MTDDIIVDLRSELGAAPDPGFEFTLPPGWERYDTVEGLEDEFRAKLKRRMMELHRPDLFAQADALLTQGFGGLSQVNAVALFMADGDKDDTMWLPASMIASIRKATSEHSLDQIVAQMIRKYDARPVDGDKRWVRIEQEQKREIQGQELIVTLIGYLTPIPGAGRSRALELTVTIMRPADVPADDEPMQKIRALFDACVTTLRWRAPVAHSARRTSEAS